MLKPASYEHVVDWLDTSIDALPGEGTAVSESVGRILAGPVEVPYDHPAAALAAVDGYALSSQATVGASDYNPLPIRVRDDGNLEIGASDAKPVVSGEKLPGGGGADTVLPQDEADLRGDAIDIYAPVAPGDNVIPSGREARGGEVLLEAGRVLRPADAALFIELGLAAVPVARRPRVGIITARRDIRDAVGPMVRALVLGDGGDSHGPMHPDDDGLAAMLDAPGRDLLLVLGGSGQGSNDHAAEALEQAGELAFRGVAINPGETTTLGMVRDTLVVVLPGPPLAALFAYDMIAGRAVRRLAGRDPALPYGTRRVALDRKIASALGRLECCRVRITGERAEPLAVSDNRTLATAVRADGFVLVPEHSEGFARDTEVEVHMYDQRY